VVSADEFTWESHNYTYGLNEGWQGGAELVGRGRDGDHVDGQVELVLSTDGQAQHVAQADQGAEDAAGRQRGGQRQRDTAAQLAPGAHQAQVGATHLAPLEPEVVLPRRAVARAQQCLLHQLHLHEARAQRPVPNLHLGVQHLACEALTVTILTPSASNMYR